MQNLHGHSTSKATATVNWNRWGLRVAIALTLATVFAVHAHPQATPPPQTSWTITDLGNLSSTKPVDFGAEALAINSSGTVVGNSGEYGGGALGGFSNFDAFIWTPTTPNATTGTIAFMGGLVPGVCGASPGTGTIGTAGSIPVGINDNGLVVANGVTTTDSTCPMAVEGTFTYLNGSISYLGGPPGFYKSTALSVNNKGQIVGNYHMVGSNYAWTAWLYDGGFHDLGVLPKYPYISTASKINNVGQIAGFVEGGPGSNAFRHSGTGVLLETDLLGTLGGPDSAAYGINDAGIVVGASSIDPTSSTYHAFVYDLSGKMRDLGTASRSLFAPISTSWAYAINKSNDVVGQSDVDNGVASTTHAVIWKNMVQIIDLNTLLDPKLQPTPDCTTCWELLYANDINDMGQIVGAGLLNGELHAFLLSPPCLTAGGDTDGDGLCDDWEKNGYTDPVTHKFVDLPHMGADPMHKDLFVQADYMVDTNITVCSYQANCDFAHTHKPNPDAIAQLTQAFANAPVQNPDGTMGINLHVDCGSDCLMNPKTGENWGDYSTAKSIIPEIPILGGPMSLVCVATAGDACEYDWTAFNNIMTANFPPERAPIFHYMIFAHSIGVFNDKGNLQNTSGKSQGIPTNSFVVALGYYSGFVGTSRQQAGTFMHELGHNLGLGHGGQDDVNYKPNYLSVMNYAFQMGGLITGGIPGLLDYSRFSDIPPLDDTSLDDHVGINGGPLTANYGTSYYCPGGNPSNDPLLNIGQRYVLNANGPIDWACSGIITIAVKSDINAAYDESTPNVRIPLYGVLNSFEDWSNLIYTGGGIGGSGISAGFRNTLRDYETQVPINPATPYDVQVVSPGFAEVLPGTSLNLTYTITNTGTQSDTYNLTPVSQSTWWNISGVPATVTLAGGATQQVTIPVNVPASLGCSNLSTIRATFSLRAVSQTHATLFDSGVAELDLVSSPTALPVPGITGLTQSEAQAAILAAGFATGAVTTNSSLTVPAGTVIAQTPSSCGFAAPGAAISILVSTGPAFVAMPNVVGDTQAMASASITSAGLVLSAVSTTASLTVPAGIVISESPAAGTNVLAGSSAGILVSSGGSATDVVPNVVGQSLGAATTSLGDMGLVLGTTTGSVSSTVAAGTVISETPSAGTSVSAGSSVNLTVSVGSSAYTVVPNIVGDTQAQALTAITSAGLLFGGLAQESSTTVPAGRVISQNPLPGLFEFAGNLVGFAVSVGPQPNTVPNVYGLTQAAAKSALAAVGLVGTVTLYPSTAMPAGDVLGQNPAPGTYATAGSIVSLTVSSGSPSPQFTVPDLSTAQYIVAAEEISAAGLTLGAFTSQLSSTVSQGYVISQSPPAGTILTPGSPVNVVYSGGSHLYPVPNVVGQGQDLATENILNAFFYLAVSRQSSTTVPDGVVISQTPAGGSQALLGAIISLVVSSGGPVMGTVPNTLYDPNAIPYGTVGTIGQAFQAIYAAGFAVGSVTTQIPPTSVFVPANYVISQNPAPGTQAPWGTSINLVISSGEAYSAVVPNLVGMTQSAAITTLQNASVPPLLKGDAFWSYALTTQSSTTVPAGNVMSQNPPPGTAIVQAPYQQQVGFSAFVLGPVNFVVSAGPSPVPSYSYLSQFGSNGGASSQDGQFSSMCGLAIDPVSRNIIVGGEDGRIQIFDYNGNFKSYFGGHGLNLTSFTNSQFAEQIIDFEGPVGNGLFWTGGQTALAVDPVNHNIVAVDVQGQRVLIFNSAGVFQSQFGTAGYGAGQFAFNRTALGIAVDPVTENILVSDSGNNRVQIFNSAGVFQSQFGTVGSGYAQFGNPSGIAIDPTSRNIVVADWGNSRVQIFNSAGGYLSQFGGPGASNGTFYEPTAIAIDPATHNILVASAGTGNTSNPYLQIFSSAGVYLSQFGGYGTGNGQFTGGSSGLAFDPVSHNIVVIGSNNSVQIFGVAASSSGSTTTTLAASSNPAAFGQPVTFTATIAGNSPTGTVQFLDGASSLGTPIALTARLAALTTSTLAVGPHSITAVYSGDTSSPGSTSVALSEVISPSPTTTTVTSSINPAIAGHLVTLSATVTGTSPTGTVEFLSGAMSLGAPVALASGMAVFSTTTLPVGTDSITAVYSGDGSNATSTSGVLSETVSLAPTITAVLSSAGHATFGQPVTFTAVVTGDGPTGNVQFFDGPNSLAVPVTMTGNIATFTTSTLAVGTHSVTAAYKGDAFNSQSTSPVFSEFVSKNQPTTTSLAASVDAILIGQSVTFTATITGSSPTGSIQFMDGITNLGSPVALTSGAASLTTSALTVGTHPMTAVYSGDTTNAPSTSAVISEVVSLNATATTVTSSINPAVTGQIITFTAIVTGKNPTGSVLFLDGATPLFDPLAPGSGVMIPTPPSLAPNSRSTLLSNGQANTTLSTLSVGTHSITAVYLGDGNNGSSTSAVLSQVIQSAAAPPVVTPPASISIPATQATGATSGAWPVLAAFLAGATATSTVSPAPTRLAPEVGGVAVTSATLFPIGTTTVTFQFKDTNGNIGSATSSVTVALGMPRVTGNIVGIGSDPSGATYFNVVLTNTGTGNARNLVIKTLTFRALSGTGTITYNTALSPSLPLAIGNLDVGATSTTRIYLNVPTTVTRIAFVESGPVQDVTGTNFTYSTAQMVIP
jgi:probable HAF family extracellular repeat protein